MTREMVNGTTGRTITPSEVLDWVMKVLLGVTTALVVSIWTTVGNLDNRVTAIESSRFTTADGLELWREVDDKVGRDELYDRLDHLEDMIQDIQQRLTEE